jgi:hypothetical protein
MGKIPKKSKGVKSDNFSYRKLEIVIALWSNKEKPNVAMVKHYNSALNIFNQIIHLKGSFVFILE